MGLRRILMALLAAPANAEPPEQTSRCAGCDRVITERRRRPCQACGSINRVVGVSAGDVLTLTDRVI